MKADIDAQKKMRDHDQLLLVPLLMVSLSLIVHCSAEENYKTQVASQWRDKLFALPQELEQLVSPLSISQIDSFRKSIDRGHLPSTFCATAGLRCSIQAARAIPPVCHTCPFTGQGTADGSIDAQRYSWFQEKLLRHPSFEVPATEFSASALTSPTSFLPRRLTEGLGKIISSRLPRMLHQLHIPSHSTAADAMRATVHICETSSQDRLAGETAVCATSLEDMAELVAGNLNRPLRSGSSTGVELVSSTFVPAEDADVLRGRFKVVKAELKNEADPWYVSGHTLQFPYQVNFLHSVPHTKVYKVTLESTVRKGYRITNAVLCHMDTVEWNPNHVALRVLASTPGHTEACHWSNGFVLVSRSS